RLAMTVGVLPSSTSAPSERSADVHERSEPSATAAAGATGRTASALRCLSPPQRPSPPARGPAAPRALGAGTAPAGGEGPLPAFHGRGAPPPARSLAHPRRPLRARRCGRHRQLRHPRVSSLLGGAGLLAPLLAG